MKTAVLVNNFSLYRHRGIPCEAEVLLLRLLALKDGPGLEGCLAAHTMAWFFCQPASSAVTASDRVDINPSKPP
jgi:hypothetical protein